MMRTVPLSPATIVFCDVVGFSKYDGDKQQRIITSLNAEVTKELFPFFGAFGSEPKTVCLPTGDGLLIVMFEMWDARLLFSLIKCLREWSDHVTERETLEPECRLRLGVHVGKVSLIPDINRLPNVCGDDINTCRRIMDQARPNQVLFSVQAYEAYVGGKNGTFSSWPFSTEAPVKFTAPMTITVKHNVKLEVQIMTQHDRKLWTGESPISAPAVIEGDGCVRTRTKLIIDLLEGLLKSDQKKFRIYEQATFSTFGITSVMDQRGFDPELVGFLQQQKQALEDFIRARCCEVKVILRPIPTAPGWRYPGVAARYEALAQWMETNLDRNRFKSDDSGIKVAGRDGYSTVEFVEEPRRDPALRTDSTFPNRLIVSDAFRIDGYRLRYGIGHGLSLVYYEEDKIQQAIKEFEDVFKTARHTSNNAKIFQSLNRLKAQHDRDDGKASPQVPTKVKGRNHKARMTV